MAIARQTTANKVKPLKEAIVRRGTLGATVAAGEIVALQSDGYWDPAVGTSVNKVVGLAIQGGASGNVIDIVRIGPAECLTGATPGANVYVSDTAGEPSESSGTKGTIIGYAETATILFVLPQVVDFV